MEAASPEPRTDRRNVARGMLPAFAYFYTVGSVGFWIPLYLRGLGWSYSLVTWAATVYFAVLTPSTIISGVLADLVGRPNRLVCIGLSLNALAVEMIIALHNNTLLVFAARAVQGLGLSAALPVALGSLSLSQGVRRGVGLTAAASASGMATGSVVGGIAAAAGPGLEWTFHTAALVSLVAAGAACGWRPPATGGIAQRGLLGAVGLVPGDVWVVAAALVLRNIFAGGVFAVLPVLFHRVLGVGLLATAVALAANPLAQTMAVPLAVRMARGRELALYSASLALTGLVFHTYLTWPSAGGVVAAQAFLGVDYALIMVSGNSYILSRTPEEIRYTSSSIYNLAFNTGWILGTLIAGPFMDAYGPEAWVSLSRLGCLAAGLLASSASLAARRRCDSG